MGWWARWRLRHGTLAQKVEAAAALAATAYSSSIGTLVQAADDPQPLVRSAVVSAIARSHDPSAVLCRLRLLSDADSTVRASALLAAAIARDRAAVPAAVALLRDSDARVRAAAAHTLGALEDPAAVPALMDRKDDPAPQVAAEVASALGRLGHNAASQSKEPASGPAPSPDRPPIETLLLQLLDADPMARNSARSALHEADGGWRQTPETRAVLERLVQRADETLVLELFEVAGDAAARVLVEQFLKAPASDNAARRALSTLRQTTLPVLQTALDRADVEPAVVLEVLEDLGWTPRGKRERRLATLYGRPSASTPLDRVTSSLDVPVLLGALRRRHRPAEVARALGRSGDASAVEALVACLGDARLRLDVIAALGGIKGPRSRAALLDLVGDVNPGTRAAVCLSLGQVGGKGVLPTLVAALADGTPEVRAAAIRGVGLLGDPSAADAIRATAVDADDGVRWAAAQTLRRLGSAEADPLVDELLRSADPKLRDEIVDALAEAGDSRAIVPLADRVRDHAREDTAAAFRALETLDRLGDERAIPILARDRGTAVAFNRVQTLGRILERCTQQATDQDLAMLATLDGIMQDGDRDPDAPLDWQRAYEVDCAPIRTVAQAEIARRQDG
jgi:HEAT repeat protein